MRRITEIPMGRLQTFPLSFSASTAVPVNALASDQAPDFELWRCDVNVPNETWAAVYAGPSPTEWWSFLVWRNITLLGRTYREAVGQLTEKGREGNGLGGRVLEAALHDSLPLLSDREGLTYPAFKLWHRRAKAGGAAILNTETGATLEVDDLKWDELWRFEDEGYSERMQLVFWPVAPSPAQDPAVQP